MIHVSVRLKRVPYRLIQNFTVVGNSGLWAVGVLLDFRGKKRRINSTTITVGPFIRGKIRRELSV